MKTLITIALLCAWTLPSIAAPATITLSVPSMDCPVCPITVKKALGDVPGVTKAQVSFEKRQATVTYDDTKTDVATLSRATKDAGYPSTPVKTTK